MKKRRKLSPVEQLIQHGFAVYVGNMRLGWQSSENGRLVYLLLTKPYKVVASGWLLHVGEDIEVACAFFKRAVYWIDNGKKRGSRDHGVEKGLMEDCINESNASTKPSRRKRDRSV